MRLLLSSSLTPVVISIFTASILVCGLTGCGSPGGVAAVATTPTPTDNSGAGVSFGGKALSGNQPLIGASVQLYAAGTSGNGSSGTPLLTSSLTTDGNGAFICPRRVSLSIGGIAALRCSARRQARGSGCGCERCGRAAHGSGSLQSDGRLKPDGGKRGDHGCGHGCALPVLFPRSEFGRQLHEHGWPTERGCDGFGAGGHQEGQ